MLGPNALPALWRVLHDDTEITTGEFLQELAELPLTSEGGLEITQQTLSNYVRQGWVPRRYVGTAPGGRGQTGFFERRMLIRALVAHDFLSRQHVRGDDQGRGDEPKGLPKIESPRAPARRVLVQTVTSMFIRDWMVSQISAPLSADGYWASAHNTHVIGNRVRAAHIDFLSRVLEHVPTSERELKAFAPDDRARAAITDLRARLDEGLTAPIDLQNPLGGSSTSYGDALTAWLETTPGSLT